MYDQYKDEEPRRVVQVSKETGISAIDEPGYNIMLNAKAETTPTINNITPVSPKVVIKNRSNYQQESNVAASEAGMNDSA